MPRSLLVSTVSLRGFAAAWSGIGLTIETGLLIDCRRRRRGSECSAR